ncbi:hypothetical protein CVV68_00290 [Arthrobacter livingstonensis]|uniref:HipA-like C-terminal domain-containing protein n=1 Tax=Arthrobacter livingstonensis TaxID=670078 RepID=A0A2V5LNW1_9MICC|nr:hypothetical protein [Arthrobacter livingstonensis]PYI69590.1 hypothetical protein CVV68_00290 [Arthrobacter livingstonensis]
MAPYEVCDISTWLIMAPEPGGDDDKDWMAPNTAEETKRSDWWLFKPAKYGQVLLKGGVDGGQYRRRDDLAEKICSELAKLIGLPAADVRIAIRHGEEGIISGNVAPAGWNLQPGNTHLFEFPGYVNCDVDPRPRARAGHNLENISSLLNGKLGPPGSPMEDWPALEVFICYLIFDAWIANTDRHALNWGLLDMSGEHRLAKSYDHGSALASGLNEADLPIILAGGLGPWCQKAYAGRFENGSKRTLVEVALEGLQMSSGPAREFLDRLASLKQGSWADVLASMPSMSEGARSFVDELLAENRKRLCDGH